MRGSDGVLAFAAAHELALAGPAVTLAALRLEQERNEHEAATTPVSAEIRAGYEFARVLGGEAGGGGGQLTSLALSATVEVLPWGPAADQRRRAALWLLEAEAALREARHEATVATTSAFLAALRAGERVLLAQEAVEIAALRLAGVIRQYEAGSVTAAALTEARMTQGQAEFALGEAQRHHEGALAALGAVVGTRVSAVSGPPPSPIASPACVAVGPSQPAPDLRADVISARSAVSLAELDLAAATRSSQPSGAVQVALEAPGGAPTLAAEFDTRTFAPSLMLGFDPRRGDAAQFRIAATVTVPLDPARDATVAAAGSALERAALNARRAEELASLEIAGRLRDLEAAEASAALVVQQLDARLALTEAAEARFELGLIPAVELLEAALQERDALLRYAEAQDGVLLATLRYRQAIGLDPAACVASTERDARPREAAQEGVQSEDR